MPCSHAWICQTTCACCLPSSHGCFPIIRRCGLELYETLYEQGPREGGNDAQQRQECVDEVQRPERPKQGASDTAFQSRMMIPLILKKDELHPDLPDGARAGTLESSSTVARWPRRTSGFIYRHVICEGQDAASYGVPISYSLDALIHMESHRALLNPMGTCTPIGFYQKCLGPTLGCVKQRACSTLAHAHISRRKAAQGRNLKILLQTTTRAMPKKNKCVHVVCLETNFTD